MNNCGRRSLIRKPIRSVLINGMCIFEVSVRKANAEISAELTSHTSPFCNDYNKLQSFVFLSLCSFFPHAKNCAYLSYSHSSSLVFDVREPLCAVRATAPCCCGAGAQSAVA